MASSAVTDTDFSNDKPNLTADQLTSELPPIVTGLQHSQQQLLEDSCEFRQCLQHHDAVINRSKRYALAHRAQHVDDHPNNSHQSCFTSSTDQSLKQLRFTKRLSIVSVNIIFEIGHSRDR